jgi:NADPH:quinone reductase-like Zn-dependent oxidoreductase
VDRRELPDDSPAAGAVDDFLVPGDEPLESVVRRATNGRGAQVVFDAVGGPIFEPALKCLAHGGRQLEITSVGDRRVSFDLLDFYHNESRLFGVDTRHRDAVASGALLEALTPVFEQGTFKAPKIDRIIPLSEGRTAYEQVARGEARGRLVLAP